MSDERQNLANLIYEAMLAVEAAGAGPELTNAIVLLEKARTQIKMYQRRVGRTTETP